MQETDNGTSWLGEANRTGEIFPGRPIDRPGIFLEAHQEQRTRQVVEKIIVLLTHIPRYIHSTVQCCCRYPNLLGLSVMSECEGVSTSLSVLLSRFQKLPRVCYYDNGSNMARSIAIRLPWINELSLTICDRFHYRGNTCNSVFDPESYRSCDCHVNSGAESPNHQWNLSEVHVRHLKGDNLIAFVAIRAVFINLKTMCRKKYNRSDTKIWTWVHFSENFGSATVWDAEKQVH